MVWGAEPGFFLNDPIGKRILREVVPKRTLEVELFEHECLWQRIQKPSTTFPCPPPRAACPHGFVAMLPARR